MIRCMGNNKTESRCQNCKRLPLTVKVEDEATGWIDPKISTKKLCTEYKERTTHERA